MFKQSSVAYLTIAVLAFVTVVGVNGAKTGLTGSPAATQAMFTESLPASQAILGEGQVASQDGAAKASDLQ